MDGVEDKRVREKSLKDQTLILRDSGGLGAAPFNQHFTLLVRFSPPFGTRNGATWSAVCDMGSTGSGAATVRAGIRILHAQAT